MGFFNFVKAELPARKPVQSRQPYTIVKNEADNTAEVNLYGEVVSNRPKNFWTDEPLEDMFIVEKEFLSDLDDLKFFDKVTFRINSVGGDADAGKAIFTRIREMNAETTTIVDGLAASAASVIFMAGDKRQMSVGSQLMIHGASTLLLGYYNANDTKDVLNMLKNYDTSLVEIYADRTDNSEESIAKWLKNTTWMTASEAVEKGFADEVINATEPTVARVAGAENVIVVNGNPMNLREEDRPMLNYNKNVVPLEKVFRDKGSLNIDNETSSRKEDIIMNLDEMKAQYPEFVDAIQAEALEAARSENEKAVNDAVMAERNRIKEIEDIQNRISDKDLVNKAKYEEVMDAKELAFEAMQAEEEVNNKALEAIDEDVAESGVEDVDADPVQGSEAEQKTQDVADGAALIANALNN